MMMKRYGFVALGAALALPLVAQGKLPIPNEAFGKIEANLDVCAVVDSKSAAKYQDAKKTIAQGATDEEVAAARESDEYKNGYKSTKQDLEKKPKAEVAKACASALEGKS
jgi:hypothetical protein